jgi:hypothetical protein
MSVGVSLHLPPKQTVDFDVLKLPGSRYLPRESGIAMG